MNITQRIQEKLDNYRSNVLMAIDYLSKDKCEDAAVRFRKTAEAFLKIVIYEHLGDAHGHKVIIGKEDQNGNSLSRKTPLFLGEMINMCAHDNNWIDRNLHNVITDIKEKISENAHDPNEPLDRALLKEKMDECLGLSEQLTNTLYSKIQRSVPTELIEAYHNGIVAQQMIDGLKMEDIDTFVDNVDGFDKCCRYILIAPFDMRELSKPLIRNILGVRWAMVIDFDCHTKEEGGLYHSLMPEIEDNCTPFTILNRDSLSNLSKGVNGNVNWIYANGLSSIQGTVTSDINAWIGKRMHHFLKDALTEFCKKTMSKIHIISLLEDDDYLGEVIRLFDNIDFAERDLVAFSIISDKPTVRDNSKKLSRYGFEINCYSFSRLRFLSEIGDFLKPEERQSIIVPGRNAQNETVWTDLTNIHSKLSANGITVVHKNIVSEVESPIATIPSFYKGETVTWKELEADVDVQRSKYEELQKKVTDRLNGRQSQKFHVYHKPGAGGTTVCRRLAYDLRELVPTIIINEYSKSTTFQLIELLSMKVNRPMLAIVEASKVGNIDDLVAECNAKKRVVMFVYVERVLKRPSVVGQPQVEFVSDRMHDAEEKEKFAYKVKLYSPPSQNMQWIQKTPYSNCEVLDFSMSIAEKDYEHATLKRYIRQYMDRLSESTAEFLAYVSLFYHYTQRPVPDLMFRSLFVDSKGKKGLTQYMRQNPTEMNYLKKLITDDNDGMAEESLWRPRYSRFADIILQELLGGETPDSWKNSLPEWSRKLIRIVKRNYAFLTDEVQKLLVAIFLEREKEDLLGQEESWGARGAQEKFSQLLDDMSYSMEDQKTILKLLAESYPSVSHFWGHLARFCYENADTPEEFTEAAEYIERALDKNGQNDFNLLHIAGMCRRRQIEYYHRKQVNIGKDALINLTETARQFFHQSREVNPRNVHAYMSEIQLLTIVIEYGKENSSYDKYNAFLVSPENTWFFEVYEELNDMIDELSILMDQICTLGYTTRVYRTKAMLANSEKKRWEYIGNYKESLSSIQEHMKNADRLSLPKLRLMYVRTLLLSKVDGSREKMIEAWAELSQQELEIVEDYLNKNVQQSAGDVNSMRMWIQLVRYSGINIPIEEVKSRLKAMYKNSDDYPMSKLEAAFNLYILNLFELIRDNDALNSRKKEEIQQWIDVCKDLSSSDKYPFEWLASLDGIGGIISFKNKMESIPLARVNGTITEIKSNAQGTIRLDCGFDVFFTPSVGYFIEGKDETTSVTMVLGFRHEGPAAYEVARKGLSRSSDETQSTTEVDDNLEISEVEAIEKPMSSEPRSQDVIFEPSKIDKPKLTIVGKIDLDDLNKYDRRQKKK